MTYTKEEVADLLKELEESFDKDADDPCLHDDSEAKGYFA